MGYHVEINTMLRLGKSDVKPDDLQIGKQYTISRSNIRIYPTDMAILLLSEDWTVLGYCAIRKTLVSGKDMEITFEILSLFAPDEQKIYTTRLKEALTTTHEI
ncbi:MAG: DUF2584 family protein [bacterium]|nr:DUF2584 family protein [bacterium]